ncbi:Peptide chain release factor 1 [Frankliniella fusca]|uniref:Peptide chain release factor 1 n=1 Tax=Frankliniella fusca TaxID=407009 RepID=A0AAE1HCI1_9NEOP|nr:Peptide chain release factor 1 [Frankliniella fusca]
MTPTEIPVSEFTFPLQVKEQRKETSNLHEDTIRSRRDDDSKLLAAYKKIQQGIQEPNTLTIEKENKVIEEDDEFESLGNLDGDHQVNLEQHVDDEGPVSKKKSKRKRKSNKGGKKIKEKVDKKDKEKIVKEPPKIPHTVPENIEPIDQGEQIDKVTEIANSSGLSGSESDIPQAEWIEAKQNHNTRKNPISNAEDKGKEGHDSLAVELSSHDTTANKKNESETHNVSGNNRGHTSSKSTQTGFLECASCQRLKTDLEISQQRLQDAYDKVKSQQETIDKLQNRRCEEDSILERMKSLMSKSEGDRKSSGAKVSKSSKLDKLPSNLLSPKDKEEVDEKLIKVAKHSYVTREELTKVETDETYFSNRVDELVNVFFKSKAHKYSVKKGSKYWISPDHISSMEKILCHMKWSYSTEFDIDKIKTRIVKRTSALRVANKKAKDSHKKQEASPEIEKKKNESSSSSKNKRKRSPTPSVSSGQDSPPLGAPKIKAPKQNSDISGSGSSASGSSDSE